LSQLILLSVPIGNQDDLSLRGKKILEEKEVFFVEDTRVFSDLLRTQGISKVGKKIYSFHEHSPQSRLGDAKRFLEQDEDVVLVSDAGSPLMSDPGYPLVKEVLAWGGNLETIPGVSSVLTALELSGLPPYPFQFHGFLPRDNQKKKNFFASLKLLGQTHVFFEGPRRVESTLSLMADCLPEAQVCVARELTKKYQSVYRFLSKDYLLKKEEIILKGEFVIVVFLEGAKGGLFKFEKSKVLAMKYLQSGNQKDLSKLLGSLLEKSSKEIYSTLVNEKNKT
jgi:16S rRNA (cytidine1402-2'-O)-methyltransferase